MSPVRLALATFLTLTLPMLVGACKPANSPAPQAESPLALVEASPTGAKVDASASSANPPSQTRTFRDWTAVCDNLNTCNAYGPADDHAGFVLIRLEAGPAARPRLLAGAWSLTETAARLSMAIDGQAFPGQMDLGLSEHPILTIERPTDPLLSALANGRTVTLSAAGQSTSISLSGAAAALLWIDERQGRLGTTTALIRKGTRPASEVPQAPAAPRLSATPAIAQDNLPTTLARQVSALPEVRQCRLDNAESPSRDDPWRVNRLGSNRLLWSLPCGAGAYNLSQVYVLSANDGSAARVVIFPTSDEPTHQIVNSDFDATTNTISAFNKGRGLGDCGQMASWQWTGTSFALRQEEAMNDCLGLTSDYWPTTWQTAK